MYGMMSGYTAGIANGSIKTGREFLKRCVRNFGCCAQWRDEPLDKPLEELMKELGESGYYAEQLAEKLKEKETWERTTKEKRFGHYIQSKLETSKDVRKRYEEMKKAAEAFGKVRSEVEAWNPPTDEHWSIKNFALEQINDSCPTREELEEAKRDAEHEILTDEPSFMEWCEGYESRLKCDINYYSGKLNSESVRAGKRYGYLKRFLDSLDDLPVE